MEKEMSVRDIKRREAILNGNLWKTILIIAIPIMFYNLCNYLYGIFDMMVVGKAKIGESADIVVLDQIKNMISQLSGSLATAGGILVARKYGRRDEVGAKRCANALFTMAVILAALTLIFIPIAVPFLKLLNTPQSTIDNSLGYFNVQILILFVTTINLIFLAIEKAKGNTLKLLILNLGVIGIKISLSSLFAFGPFKGVTVTWLAVATLIAQSFLFVNGLVILFMPRNILRISFKTLNLNKSDVKTILKLALPVFVGRFVFHFGKVYINAEATRHYHDKRVVGALGFSNTIAGLLSNMINSFEDSGSTITSQNFGAKNGSRIQKAYFINFVYIMIMSIVGTLVLFFTRSNFAHFFAPDDKEYQTMIIKISAWECMDVVFMGLNGVGMAALYGFGKTKITMTLSTATLVAFRIPILMICMYALDMPYTSCGVAMFGSNCITGTICIILATTFILRLPKNKKYELNFDRNNNIEGANA